MQRSRQSFLSIGMLALIAFLCCPSGQAARSDTDKVTLWKMPAGAIQPQAAVDSKGVVHIVYFKGQDSGGNLFYIHRAPGQNRPSAPIQVNSEPGTAGAIGTVRVANIAIGVGDRVHIAWNGLGPRGPNGYPEAYAAYTRLNDAGTAFEPQRNLTTWARVLDGGSSVAADRQGNVYVVWHALGGAKDETGRAVYVALSKDDGKTFARERQANPEPTGACGCCGMRAFVDKAGSLYVLYRSAEAKVNRDTMLLVSRDSGQTFQERTVDKWNINACPMSTYALTQGGSQVTAAWETQNRVFYARLEPGTLSMTKAVRSEGDSQKHPTVAVNDRGETLVAWAEGTGWQRGGTLVWQVYDSAGRPISDRGRGDGIPVWGLPTAYVGADGKFVIVY